MSEPKKPVLVTGAAGYLASWIVHELLESGYPVHGTVRRLEDDDKLQHLHDLAARHDGRLRLYEADLTREGSFDAAMAGCEVVIHVASPYFLDTPTHLDRQLIKPALGGTFNVLGAVNRTSSVRRVVLTSSTAALYNDACDVAASRNHTVNEDDVNPNTDSRHNPYAYSKTVAEQAAWQICRSQTRWHMVSIHPGAIFGPSLSRRSDPTSVSLMVQFLQGSFRNGVPRLWLGLVDVRDAALAHVRAAMLPHAHDRYIVVAGSLRLLEMARMMRVDEVGLRNRLPRSEAPKMLMWLIGPLVGLRRRYVARNVNHPLRFDNRRSQSELGLNYRSPAQTLNDHIRQIVDDGLIAAT